MQCQAMVAKSPQCGSSFEVDLSKDGFCACGMAGTTNAQCGENPEARSGTGSVYTTRDYLGSAQPWPGGRVPYCLEDGISSKWQHGVEVAMAQHHLRLTKSS